MFGKILLTAGIIGLVLIVVLKPWSRKLGGRANRRVTPIPAEELIKCPSCGTYRIADRPCDCA